MEGWIKLHRKILDNPVICKDSDYYAVWNYLLLNATHKTYDVNFNGKRTTLNPGQLITGRKIIAEKFKVDESKVQRILKSFENEQQIEQQKGNRNRLITIVNWNEYQEFEQQNEQQVNNNCTTNEQQVNTNNNEKNIKNDKNVEEVVGVNNKNNISDSCVDGLLNFYENNIAPATPYIIEIINDYLKDFSAEIIKYAMQQSAENNTRSIKYIKAILNSWKSKGIKTILEAKEEAEKFKQGKKQENKKGFNNYDQRTYNNFENIYANLQ